ncbi:single-stranded-DNA-specific exonuclease RecJ [Metabacillus sp. RGM 3146]|uniref:single-stranded-DNA-specific exonuclease RecJ n=1 Tax=Metabacillus sp. RGM 3146 TaxID=3401092 RepID=UPI003B9D8D51
MLKAKTRWSVADRDPEKVQALAEGLKLTPLVSSLLVNRGIQTVETAKAFLYTEDQDFHDPFLLDGMDLAIIRIKQAIEKGEKICIYGDYDADGVSSTTVLMTALKRAGAIVQFYIPNRFTEGYGPNEEAFQRLQQDGVSLIITVDTGISAVKEAALAKEIGVDLIITDHHEPGPVIPEALAIVHPKKRGTTYPFKELAGAGVAFKLAHALLGEVQEDLLEVAAIGTIADLVPLQGENRLIAQKGIQQMKQTKREGLIALLKIASAKKTDINEETIGFALAPRINAAGRLENADPAVELLMTEDPSEAVFLAEEIDRLNRDRQKMVSDMTKEAIFQVQEMYPPENNSVLIVAKEGWNAGVVGIVASKLVEKFYRPAIVLSIDSEKGLAKGSARSIAGFDLFENLSECRDLLPHFGGHTMAAGMTLEMENIPELRRKLNELAYSRLTEEDFKPVTMVDRVCKLEEISVSAIEEMNMLAPFGATNPKPVIMIEDISLEGMRKIGSNQTHIKMILQSEEDKLDCVGFGFGYLKDEIAPLSTASLIGELSINEWNNFRKPQLMLKDLSIKEWQLFDFRGAQKLPALLAQIPDEKAILIAFQNKTAAFIESQGLQAEIHSVLNNGDAAMVRLEGKFAVFLDTPKHMNDLQGVFSNGLPDRIYTVFRQDEQHFFSTLPTREHFKWFYAFLIKKGPFDIRKHGDQLAKHKGWTKNTIEFMSKVFFELDFVTIDDGMISVKRETSKRDLSESVTYQRKKEQLELENRLLYSSYSELKTWFDDRLRRSAPLVNV